jgi:peptide methionine sulfoxide reductase MsrB
MEQTLSILQNEPIFVVIHRYDALGGWPAHFDRTNPMVPEEPACG